MSKMLISAIMAVVCAVLPVSGGAAALRVSARLDSATLNMGRLTALRIDVVQEAGQRVEFPALAGASEKGLLPLCGDSVEMRAQFVSDTTRLGADLLKVSYVFPLQAFVPGVYSLPPLEVKAGNDTASTLPLALKVTGPQVTANDTLSPDAAPVGPYYNNKTEKYTDKIPDALYYYWWVWVIGILAVALGVWGFVLWRRSRAGNPLFKTRKPVLAPYPEAIDALKRLRAMRLCEEGRQKEYYVRLTDILRRYLSRRFGIEASEMTSAEILRAVTADSETKSHRETLDEVLRLADLVKFAKLAPLPDENIRAFTLVLDFVKQTRPQDEPQKNQQQSSNTSAS